MHSDRELLELAANAADIKVEEQRTGRLFIPNVDRRLLGKEWNPLSDDGDAFRLASKLNMTVEFGNNCVEFPLCVAGPGTDPLEATRRAIVLAAAEIGHEKMQHEDWKKQNT